MICFKRLMIIPTLFITLQSWAIDRIDQRVDILGVTLSVTEEDDSSSKSKSLSPRTPASLQISAIESPKFFSYIKGLSTPLQSIELEGFLSSANGLTFHQISYSSKKNLRYYLMRPQDLYQMKNYLQDNKIMYFTLKGHEQFKVILYRAPEANYIYFLSHMLKNNQYNRFFYSLRQFLEKKFSLSSEIRDFKDFHLENWHNAQQDYPTSDIIVINQSSKLQRKVPGTL